MNRIAQTITRFYTLIQTELPSGRSSIITTHCSLRSVEDLMRSLQKNRQSPTTYVYSIDTVPVWEPYRRCDQCKCRTKG